MKYVFEKKKKMPYLCCLCFLKRYRPAWVSVSVLCSLCRGVGAALASRSDR